MRQAVQRINQNRKGLMEQGKQISQTITQSWKEIEKSRKVIPIGMERIKGTRNLRAMFLNLDCVSELSGSITQNTGSTPLNLQVSRLGISILKAYMFSHMQANLGTTDFRDRTHQSWRLLNYRIQRKGTSQQKP